MLLRSIWLLPFLGWVLLTQANEITPQQALQRLIEGNERYQQEKLLHPNRSKEARLTLADGQNPFAAILGCSDSRVSPEIIFDQGIGDLFIVRVAGNVVSPVVLDSVEYSALYLKSSIVLVLGHQNCGAVQAVINGQTKDIESVAALIAPSLELAKTQQGSIIENTVKDNVIHVVQELKKSPTLDQLVKQGKLDIIGGYYNFHTGAVEFVTPISSQSVRQK